MKIKKLILENINSLYGHWEIDFSSPELAQNGIFAITGTTGSGKTSILDAMCLALYAETPRINGGGRVIGKDVIAETVISKNMGNCFAELTFESEGKTYIATFEIPKTSKGTNVDKPNGKSATHKLSCNGKVLAEKSKTLPKVKEVTGLDRDAFCRSVMLAQGKFDAFLTAEKNEKEAILAQITGIDIYDQIETKLKDLRGAAKAQVDRKQDAISQQKVLSAEEEQQKRDNLTQLNQTKVTLDAECKTAEANHAKLLEKTKAVATLQREENALADAQKASDNAKSDRDALTNARKVQEASELKDDLETANKTLADINAEIDGNQKKTAETEQNLAAAASRLTAAVDAQKKADEERTKLTPVLTDVRRIDNELTSIFERQKDVKNDGLKKETELENLQQEQDGNQEEQARLTAENQADKDYLANHASDRDLPTHQARWQEQLKQYLAAVNTCEQRVAEESNAKDSLDAAVQNQADCEKERQTTEQQKSESDAKLADLEQQLSAAGDKAEVQKNLDQAKFDQQLYRTVEDLEKLRANLKENESCPLCGSLIHPFAKEIPEEYRKSKEEAIAGFAIQLKRIETLEGNIKKAQLDCAKKIGAVDLARQACENAANAYNTAKSRYDNACNVRQTAENERNQRKTDLASDLRKFGFLWNGAKTLPADIQKRIDAFNAKTANDQAYQAKMVELQNDANVRAADIQNLTKLLAENGKTVNELSAKISDLQTERQQKFGNRKPDVEESNAKAKCDRCNSAVTDWTGKKSSAEASLNALKSRSAELEAEKTEQTANFNRATESFQAECAKIGLSVADVERMAMPIANQNALQAKINEIDNALKNCRDNCEKAKDAFEKASAAVTIPDTLEDLEKTIQAKKDELGITNQGIGGLKQELEDNDRKKVKFKALEAELNKLKDEFDSWQSLYDIIGANKIKNYAHTITFDALLVQANEELGKLSTRYQLARDKNSGRDDFSINVIDNEEGGIQRTVSNLSGGERFIVSLALALGLCQLNARTMRIDSLFLDEGFGSLDEETCYTVLKALEKLRAQGKTIGIITHVPTVENMMRGKILHVESVGGGKSRITGPGVKQ